MSDTSIPAFTVARSFGQILDRLVALLRTHFKVLVGIAAAPMAACFALYAVAGGAMLLVAAPWRTNAATNPQTAALILIPVLTLGVLPIAALMALGEAALAHAATQADRNLPVTAREAWSAAWSKGWRYVWLAILRILVLVVPVVVAGAIVGGGALIATWHRGDYSPAGAFFLIPLVVLFYVGAAVYTVYMLLHLALAVPACVCEDLPATQALSRSGKLTRGAKGRIFLVALIVYAFTYLVEMVLFAVLAILIGCGVLLFMALHVAAESVAGIAGIVVAALVLLAGLVLLTAVVSAAYSTGFAIIYNDQRLRVDGPPQPPVTVPEPE